MQYKTIAKQTVYNGRLIKVQSVQLSHNYRIFRRETVIHPGAVAILPVLSYNQIMLVRQFRYATTKELWEIPAGTIERGETPLPCARRELLEETGYTARSFKKLVDFYPSPGYSSEVIHLYMAKGLVKTASLKTDADENITVKIFTRTKVARFLRGQRIIDAKTVIGLLLWLKK